MHFVFGGAFNGKAKWIKERYRSRYPNLDWRSAYDPAFNLEQFETVETFSNGTVLEGIENYVKEKLSEEKNIDKLRSHLNELLTTWIQWEQKQTERTLILIGNDLSKGVVPIDKNDRLWRDVAGWFYQDIAKNADRVDLIWYGIAKRLK